MALDMAPPNTARDYLDQWVKHLAGLKGEELMRLQIDTEDAVRELLVDVVEGRLPAHKTALEISKAAGSAGLPNAADFVFPLFGLDPPKPEVKQETPTKGPRIRLIPFDDIRPDLSRRYLVKGLMPRVGMVVVWGPPKCGKSFWVFDIAMHIALGWEYRGRRIRQGAVVYCAFEGQSGFEARVEAFRRKFLPESHDPIPFFLQPTPLVLAADHRKLIDVILAKLGSEIPALIVLDTLNRSIGGSESDDETMSLYVKAADVLRDRFNCAVVIVHHCGHDATRPRGHTALIGALDTMIAVKRDDDGNIVCEVQAQKDGPEGEIITSRLEVVEIGVDEDGDEIKSCVIEAAPNSPDTASKKKPRKANKAEATFDEAYNECMFDDAFEHRVVGNGPYISVTKLTKVRDQFRRRYATGEGDEKARAATLRKAWERAIETLRDRGYATEVKGEIELVWRATKRDVT